MRPLTIDLDELAVALDSPGLDHYFDLANGQVLLAPPDAAVTEFADLLEDEPERLIPIEPLSGEQSLELMRDFLPEVAEPNAYAALASALEGRRPVKAFHHVLMGYPVILQAWHVYQSDRLRELALDWLAAHELQPAGRPAFPG
ncbi:hypothetical protein D9M71_134020 [compost metagenome]